MHYVCTSAIRIFFLNSGILKFKGSNLFYNSLIFRLAFSNRLFVNKNLLIN